MKRTTERGDEGYALRGGKVMKGREALVVDPEVLGLCLSSGLSSGEVPLPTPVGDRRLRIATFIHAHRTLDTGH